MAQAVWAWFEGSVCAEQFRGEWAVRVLFVASEAPPVQSGLAHVVGMARDSLAAAGHDVGTISGAELHRLTVGEFRFNGLALSWPQIARELPLWDVVNVHGPAPTMSDVFLGLSGLTQRAFRPAIVYTHHFDIDLPGLAPVCDAYNHLTRLGARVADRIIVSTPSYADTMGSGDALVDVIPWAVSPLKRQTTEPRVRSEGPLRVLFVGQMRAYKGLPSLIEAVRGHPDLRLTLAGDGALAAKYQELAAQLCPTADWLGAVDDVQLRRLYEHHDVIVLPSERRVEAFGLVLIEGMAAGCIPVASDLPGVRDVAGPTGLLFPPGDAMRLRHALLSLAADPAMRQRLSAASVERAAHYGVEVFAERYRRSLERAYEAKRRDRVVQPIPSQGRKTHPSLKDLTVDFSASWGSVQWFDGSSGRVLQGWGRAAKAAKPGDSSVARYVATKGTPTVIDLRSAPDDLAPLLERDDIASAIATPIASSRGRTGVVSLTRAADDGRYEERDARLLAGRLTGNGRHQAQRSRVRPVRG